MIQRLLRLMGADHAPPATTLPWDAQRLCGQLALAYVSARPLAQILTRVGHRHPMTMQEVRTYVHEYLRTDVTVLHRDVLTREARETWFRYGGDAFFALMAEFDTADDKELGHIVVINGTQRFDPALGRAERVKPECLREYEVALILSARMP